MAINRVLLIGGSGFIGTSVAEQLSGQGVFVTVPTRNRERAKHLLLLPTVDAVEANVFDAQTLDDMVRHHDAVINLTGILHGDFDRVHIALPKLVAEACARVGVARLINMSALNAGIDAPSEYLRSRGRGEAAVWAVAGAAPALSVTVFQPSVVFGERDKFLNLFASLVKLFPVIPLGSPDATFQPVWVEDVARAIVASLPLADAKNRTFVLVGPKVYTLRELVEFVIAATAKRRMIVGLGPALSMLQASVFGMLPGKLLTPDNVRSMTLPNVSDQPYPAQLGRAHPMEGVVNTYMQAESMGGRARYQGFRDTAGR